MKLLLVGPLPIAGDVIGGTKVSFSNLVRVLAEDRRFEIDVHSISRPLRGLGRMGRAISNLQSLTHLLMKLMFRSKRYDAVMFNTSSGGALLSGPLVWAACRRRGLPLCLRVFGGDLDLFLERAPRLIKELASRTILRSDLVLVQTRMLEQKLASLTRAKRWPTTRDLAHVASTRRTASRFLFLSQLRPEKGVAEALHASERLPAGATLTLYGPAMPGFDVASCGAFASAEYRGPLAPEQVPAVLAEHDVLVFPSYHEGEGLPGIVIEALQSGMPVICSRWRALPELIEHNKNGLLVEPRSADELGSAMCRLAVDESLFEKLSMGASITGELYSGAAWNQLLGDWLFALDNVVEPSKAHARPAREQQAHREAA